MNARTRTVLTGLALAPLALGLTACGGDGDDDAAPAQPTVTVTESGDADQGGDQGGDQGQGQGQGGQQGAADDDAIRAAAQTALGEVEGTVVNIDRQAAGWEVDVVADDGTETSVGVSEDGGQVAGQPRQDTDDPDDVAENQALLQAASIDWEAALDTARGELGDAAIDELDLSEDDGRVTWEVSTPDDGGTSTTVLIDAASGDVLGTETDD